VPDGSVPDAVAPPPRHPRFPLIDGLRAIAVLSVVLVHAATLQGGAGPSLGGRLLAHLNIGVTIFFLISGFLLYRPFIAHRGGGPLAPELAQYAKRRFLRIYPAYWLALSALVLLPGVVGIVNGEWWMQYGLIDTLPLHGGSGCVGSFGCGLAHTWSLVVEVTFYACLPLYALAVGRLTRGWSVQGWMLAELLLLAGLSAISVVIHFVLTYPGPRSWVAGTVVGFGFWFALGMALAVASVGLERRERSPAIVRLVAARPLVPWLLALGGYTLLCLSLPPTAFILAKDQQLAVHLSFGLIAALLLLPAVLGDRSGGLPRRALANPVVAWLGLVSYGIFLWHYVVVIELAERTDAGFGIGLLATLAFSIPIAAASYYLLERPLLRLKYRRFRDWRTIVRGGPDPAPPQPPAASPTQSA
jgi:peptidoglycan/LPS O-acetylase OafA/YrhL